MYTNIFFDRKKNNIIYWEMLNGEKVKQTKPAPLFFYIEDEEGEYKNIYNKPCKKKTFNTYSEMKKSAKSFTTMGENVYESDVPIETKFVIENYAGQDLSQPPEMRKHFMDIEVHSSEGFPRPEDANFPITINTVWDSIDEQFYIWSEKDFDTSFMDDSGEKYTKFIFGESEEWLKIKELENSENRKDKENAKKKRIVIEKALLKHYIEWTAEKNPTMLSGWNCLEENQTVWMNNSIVKIKDISNKHKNKPLFNPKTNINKFGYTGEKEMYKLKTALGKEILCSKEHIFFTKTKQKEDYRKFKTIKKIKDRELSINDIQKEIQNKDVYLNFKINQNTKKNLTYKEFLLDKEILNRMLSNDKIDIFITNPRIIKRVTNKKLNTKDFYKRNLEWLYKRNSDNYTIDELLEDIEKTDILQYSFGNRRRTLDLNKEIDPILFQILGFLFTDGCLSENQMVFTQKDKQVLEYYADVVKQNFNPRSITIKEQTRMKFGSLKTSHRLRVAASHMNFLLLFIYDGKTKNSDITMLSKLSKEQFLRFITGCYDGDGYVSNDKSCGVSICNFDCKKINFLQNLQETFLWNGFLTSVNPKNTIIHIRNTMMNKELITKIKDYSFHKRRSATIILSKLKEYKDSSNKKNNFCYNEKEGFVKILSIENTNTKVKMYDIETTNHEFITSGCRTHNCNGFDLPYIINRTNKLFGKKEDLEKIEEINRKNIEDGSFYKKYYFCEQIKKISPIKHISAFQQKINKGSGGGKFTVYDDIYSFGGIANIDMMDVWKEYTFGERSSWALNSVAEDVLGEKKLEYDGTLQSLYEDDWQTYVEYNVHDVRLLKKLEDKQKFLNLLVQFCYGCRIPFDFYTKTVRILDGAFLSELYEDKIVLPDVDRTLEHETFPGGYVKEPKSDLYEWIVSYDLTSLYPSIMRQWNISPEMKVLKVDTPDIKKVREHLKDNNKHLEHEVYIPLKDKSVPIEKFCKWLKDKNYTFSNYGVVYNQEKEGFIPSFLTKWFNERKRYKGLMQQAETDGDKQAEVYYDSQQHNRKILLNSVYGYLGTRFSRLYDLDNAMSVTLNGQSVTKRAIKSVDNLFRKNFEKTKLGKKLKFNKTRQTKDIVIYGDTDSSYYDDNIRPKSLNGKEINFRDFYNISEKDSKNDTKKHADGRDFVFFKNNEQLPYYDEEAKKVVYGKIDYIYRHFTTKNIFKIKTKTGKEINVTEDHTCIVLDNEGLTKEVKPLDIKKGDKIIKLLINKHTS